MPESNRSQPLATNAPAIGQSSLAAFGGVTIQKAVLPLAADFRRLILAFHKLNGSIKRGLRRENPRNFQLTKSARG